MNLKHFSRDILILLAALAVAIGGYMSWDNHTYHDTSQAKVSLQQAAKAGDDTILIFHKTGCSDCRKVVADVNRGISQNTTSKIVVDDTKNSDLYKDYQVSEVPTFIRLHNGQEINRYSGTDTQEIASFLEASEQK
ncbi:thioredoxin family protein [Weissella confusa]|uniref:thioredoxin family protein n=1 Tax=Weissella confusa TaxID=1583 RepID=UPI00223C1B8B|nr:thioredoxin family protein [Weissella confusa]